MVKVLELSSIAAKVKKSSEVAAVEKFSSLGNKGSQK
jgi:hypothetical protein